MWTFLLCMMIHFSPAWDMIWESRSHEESNIPLALLGQGPHDQTGRVARQSGMWTPAKWWDSKNNLQSKTLSLLQYEIWVLIVLLICCILWILLSFIVNTSTYFNSLLFWMIAQNVKENVTCPCSLIGQKNIIRRHHWLFSSTT